MQRKRSWFITAVVVLAVLIAGNLIALFAKSSVAASLQTPIRWVDFNITAKAMKKALDLDIASREQEVQLNWVEMLAYLGTKYSGNFGRYKAKDLDALAGKLKSGMAMAELTKEMKHYEYYWGAYSAALGGMVGEYRIQTAESIESGTVEMQTKYGLKAYSPIAYGYSFSHYDDFGNSRSYGFSRNHLGNDLVGSVGTPIIAVESGIVETMGWNRYGGWRVGVRSLDGMRYYYYAHMRKGRPYHADLKKGEIIRAGDIIGYLGMTGYSVKEDVNGMRTPHLHFGLQLIFEPPKADGSNEIWIDVYEMVKFLEHHKSPVVRDAQTKEYYRKYQFIDPAVEALDGKIPEHPKLRES